MKHWSNPFQLHGIKFGNGETHFLLVLNGAILQVDVDGEPIQSNSIPAEILFKVNRKGKLEFKDNSKQKPQNAPEEMKAETVIEQQAALKKAPHDYTCVTKRGPVNIKKIFNPVF